MIVVTGPIRSGTSWVMQTLHGMGVRVYGEQYWEYHDEELHPGGTWEMPPGVLQEGVHDKLNGAIKVFPEQLWKSDISLIDTLVVCNRDEQENIESIIRYLRKMQPHTGLPSNEYYAAGTYLTQIGFLREIINAYDGTIVDVSFDAQRAGKTRQILETVI